MRKARPLPSRAEIRAYFDGDRRAVSSPATVFGVLTPWGEGFLERYGRLFGGRVLDAGAGLGVLSREIAARFDGQVVAVDLCRWLWELPRSLCPVTGDLAGLPFADATFDTVVCLEVLEHTREPRTVLAELARVLQPRGSLLLSTPSYLNPAGALKTLLEATGLYEPYAFAPFDAWSPKVLERPMLAPLVARDLRRAGFTLERVEGAEIFDAFLPFANRVPGLFRLGAFLRLRAQVDRLSSWPLLKWLSLHGIFHAVKGGRAGPGEAPRR